MPVAVHVTAAGLYWHVPCKISLPAAIVNGGIYYHSVGVDASLRNKARRYPIEGSPGHDLKLPRSHYVKGTTWVRRETAQKLTILRRK